MFRPSLRPGVLLAIVVLLLGFALTRAQAIMPTTIDVSQAFTYSNSQGQQVNLSAITVNSTPTVITQKFLALIRYFNEMGLNGTITIPAGTWLLNQTLYLNQYSATQKYTHDHGVNLVGAGQTATILQAAPGYENMTPVQIGLYQQQPNQDENAYHRPQITGVSILDSSVTTTKYGYRTLSVPPAGTYTDRGPWVIGTAYHVNDLVTLCNGPVNVYGNPSVTTYLCTTANTASSGNEPPSGDWTSPPAWALNTAYSAGNIASVTNSSGVQCTYMCTNAHTTCPENNASFTIATASRTGTTVTITTTTAHGLSAGALAAVKVVGIPSTNYDMNTQGEYVQIASVPNSTTLTYNWAGNDTTSTPNSGATVIIYDATQPGVGVSWHAYWRQINTFADGFLENTPLAVGPLDPATNYTQPTYWPNTTQFTLDLCVDNNNPAPMNGTICGVLNPNAPSSYVGSVWSLYSNGTNLYFVIPQNAGVANEKNVVSAPLIKIGSAAPGQGVHRISIQIDFRNGYQYMAAWVDGVQQGINGNNATYALPAGAVFMPYVCGGLYLGRDGETTADMNSSDLTFAGLCISNVDRYSVSTVGSQQARADAKTLNDNLRYFTQDANTIGYLTLDDTPPADTDYNNPAWQTVREQTGDASTPNGYTPSMGTGLWVTESWNLYCGACYMENISNLTVQKLINTGIISSYGDDVTVYQSYGPQLQNVTLNGGFTAFDEQPHPSNLYCVRLYNVSLNAAYAGFYTTGDSQTIANGLTFPSPGKHAILNYNGGDDFRNVTIGASTYSDYLVKELGGAWMDTIFSGVTITADPHHTYPTNGVFYHEMAGGGAQELRVDNCTAPNLPPGIVFIELPDCQTKLNAPWGDLVVTNPNFSVYNDGQLAAFVRADSPKWHARISGCTNALTQYVAAWLDHGDIIPWHYQNTVSPYTNYFVDDMVSHVDPDGVTRDYRCICGHGYYTDSPNGSSSIANHEPKVGSDWANYWVEQEWCNIKFIHPDFTALPSTGSWVQGCHILQIPSNPNGTTEYRCVASGNAGSSTKSNHPSWAPVNTTPPTVTLTGPNAGNYLAGSTLTLTATASSTTGDISSVIFYQGTTLLGSGTEMNGVYTYYWNNVPVGSYSLTAVAYDTHAAWTISSPVDINVDATQCATPTFNPVAGTYSSAQNVIIGTTTGGATIRYTTDGSTPSESHGTVYTSAVNISATCTLQAIAYETGIADSPIASGIYTISSQCATPTFNPGASTYNSAQNVAISTATGGATIRYTTDGSTPSETHGTVYSTPVNISVNTTLQAIAYETGLTDSQVASGVYVIQCATPTFSPGAGSYSSAQNITISTATGGATIRYTTDGSTPTETHGTVYSGAVNISVTCTLQAIAYETGWTDSGVASGVYTITASMPTTGMLLWLKADAITGLSNGNSLTTWNDSSGNGNNAVWVHPNGETAPLYETNVFNGEPAVYFPGTSVLQVSSLTMGAYSIAAVFKTTASQQLVYEHSDNTLTNSNGNFLYTSTGNTVAVKRNGVQTGKDILGSNAGAWAAGCSGPILTVDEFGGTDASEALFINGAQMSLLEDITGSLNNTTTYSEPFNIGEREAYGDLQFNGDIAEIVVYNHVLSTADFNSLNTALTTKYALDVPPTVSITSPTNNSSYTAPASITITASATANTGTISKMEFYDGTVLLATVTSAPYTYTWNNAESYGSSFALTAKAYDSNGFATVSAPITITVNDTNLAAFWKFDDDTGPHAADSSGNGNTGNCNGSYTWMHGKINCCLGFDGSTAFVGHPSSTGLPAANVNQTECFWMYVPSTPSAEACALCLSNGSNSGVNIGYNSSTTFGVWKYLGGLLVSTTTLPTAGAWHHIAYTLNGTTNTLYIDGTAVNTSTTATNTGNAPYMYAAIQAGVGNYLPGDLDEVRVYTRALSAAEIAGLAAGLQ